MLRRACVWRAAAAAGSTSGQAAAKKPVKLGLSPKQLRYLRDTGVSAVGVTLAACALLAWLHETFMQLLFPYDHTRVSAWNSNSLRDGIGLQAELKDPTYAAERGAAWGTTLAKKVSPSP